MNAKILITIPFGMSARNILRTDVFRQLKENCRVVILSRLIENKQFVEEFTDEKVKLYDLPDFDRGWKKFLFNWLRTYWLFQYARRTGSDVLWRRYERLKSQSRASYYQMAVPAYLLDVLKLWKLLRPLTRRLLLHHPYYTAVLHREAPDLVMSMDPLSPGEDLMLISDTKRLGIATVGFVHSWDNIAKNSNPWIFPDKLLVWNNIMKEQAKTSLGYREEDIFPVGIPQYDEYLFKTPIQTADEFKTRRGIPLNHKIITYTCSWAFWFPDEKDFLLQLASLVQQKTFGDATLLIRLHPDLDSEAYRQVFGNSACVGLDEPGPEFQVRDASWCREDGIQSYVNLLYHSDVVINLASTVTIDAAIFDKPVVNVAYNSGAVEDSYLPKVRYHQSDHYGHILATGGVRLAYSQEELVQYVKMYLDDPSVDSVGRRRIIEQQCYRVDGKAGERIVNLLFVFIRDRKRGSRPNQGGS